MTRMKKCNVVIDNGEKYAILRLAWKAVRDLSIISIFVET